jgi:hypothetical protein
VGPLDIVFSIDTLGQTGPQRRTHNIIEEESAVDQHDETDDLEPFEGLPAKGKRDEPNEQSTAGVDGTTRGSRHGASD